MANHPKLIEPFHGCRCDGSHTHDTLNGGRAKACETWPWAMARKICEGVILLRTHLQSSCQPQQAAYPAVGTDTREDPGIPGTESWRGCPGCRGRQAKTDPRHSRIRGICLWPDVQPIIWGCPACARHKPHGHPSHTYDMNCKHAVITHRTGVPRSGRHPRPPDQPASTSPTVDLQPQLADGTDLGAEDERRAAECRVTPDGLVPQKPPPEVIRLAKYRSWTKACNGNPVLVMSHAVQFAIPDSDREQHEYRTTWAKVGDSWYQLELAVHWKTLENPTQILPGHAKPLITIFHPSRDIDLTPFLTTTTDLVPIDNTHIRPTQATFAGLCPQEPSNIQGCRRRN